LENKGFHMLSEIPDNEFCAALDACASEVLWEAGVSEPPVDALCVAEALGLVVARDDSLPYRGRFVRLAEQGGSSQATIVVGQSERPEREQWTVAHEIGESVAYRVYERLGIPFCEALPASRELVANRLASCLLLPRRWFASDAYEVDWDLLQLKDRYATASHELIARRMLEMRPPVVITVFDLGRVHWRRSNVTARAPGLLPIEHTIWREAHESSLTSEAVVDPETGIENVRCWAIHEPGWKREIMRSEITEYC
jgi:Zn-dependent peptidase ImmA (M78 family)